MERDTLLEAIPEAALPGLALASGIDLGRRISGSRGKPPCRAPVLLI